MSSAKTTHRESRLIHRDGHRLVAVAGCALGGGVLGIAVTAGIGASLFGLIGGLVLGTIFGLVAISRGF